MKVERNNSFSHVKDEQNFQSLKDMLWKSQCVTNTAVKERVIQVYLELKEETGTTMTIEEYIDAEYCERKKAKVKFNHRHAMQDIRALEQTTPQVAPTMMSSLRLQLRKAAATAPKFDVHMTKIYHSMLRISVVLSRHGTFQSSEAVHKLPTKPEECKDFQRMPVMGKRGPCEVLSNNTGKHSFTSRPILARSHSDSLLHYKVYNNLSGQTLDDPLLPAGSLLVDFPTRRSITPVRSVSSEFNSGLQQSKSTLIDTELSLSDESDESEAFTQVDASSRRFSEMTNSKGRLKISWRRFPSKDDSFVACQSLSLVYSQETSQTRMMSGLEYLAPGRRPSILRMMGS